MKSLEDEFGNPSELLSNVPGHLLRQIYHRDEARKHLSGYPKAESLNTSTVATLDVWENADMVRYCGYMPMIPPLLEIVSNWSYGTHATLHVTTYTEFVLPGNIPTRDYVRSLKPSVLRSMKDRFLHSHQRHANNGYVLFQEPHS